MWRKLQTMMELLFSSEDHCCHDNANNHVTSLQKLITETMMEWAGQEIHDLKLIGQIFALLYRQFDEIHEVRQALSKTYIIDIKENGGRPNYDIGEFREALGSLRLHMKVGMGKTEENLLRDSLKYEHLYNAMYIHVHDVLLYSQKFLPGENFLTFSPPALMGEIFIPQISCPMLTIS